MSKLLSQLIEESRNTVRGLRVRPAHSEDLERALSNIPQDLGIETDAKFRLIVEGEPRPLVPAIRNDMYWIAREGLANAFRHSQATLVETQIEYSGERFRLIIRDNGRGITEEILQSGRENHWGLSGMSERAERIGAQLELSSAAAADTEIELTVRAAIAFEPLPSVRWPASGSSTARFTRSRSP